MNFLKFFFIFFLVSFFLSNCAKKEKTSLIVEEDVELQMIRAFKEGYDFEAVWPAEGCARFQKFF